MPRTPTLGRAYFALQAAMGAAWWIAVAVLPPVRLATLGDLAPLPVALLDVPLFVVGSLLAASGLLVAARVATGWTCLVALLLVGYSTVTGQAGAGAVLMVAAAGGSVTALLALLDRGVPVSLLLRGPFRFRPARAGRRRSAYLAATLAQAALFWGVLLIGVPTLLLLLEQRWALHASWGGGIPVGAALLVAATALGVAAAAAMSLRGEGTPLPAATANRLVVAGPYRVVRNPMAVAGVLQGLAVGAMLSSWFVVLYALAGAVLWHVLIRPPEEADLQRRFGTAYLRYRAHVRCWVPAIRPDGGARRTAP
ncbi:methyltransferase family protein [Amnibacterium endophyticum]|uniref:Methyltransferase family protein n=1 Tax=Amnibacterium endophyticum TaxID=2109337 RepID=A0ABW4LB18_9MICO